MDKLRRIIREEPLRRRAPAFLSLVDRRECLVQPKQLRFRPHLRKHRAVVDLHMLPERVGPAAIQRIERDGIALWRRVADAYRALAEGDPERYVVVDGRRPVAEVAQEIRDRLR